MEIELANGAAPLIWALSDGAAGNARQARALAGALARRARGRVEVRTLAVRAPWDRLPPWGWSLAAHALGGAREGGWPFTGLADGGASLARPWPDVVIGCGRRVAPVAAAMRQIGGVRAVQVLDPQMRLSAFDAVVAPRHDRLRGPAVIETLGALNDLDAAGIAAEAAKWRPRLAHLPRPRVAVLVGGPSRSCAFGARALQGLTDALVRLAVDGAGLMVTPSRRTPRAVIDRLAEALGGVGGWLWSGVGDNPYPAVLGLADAIIVTQDSVNMASEAAFTGKPILIAPVERVAPKIVRFHAALAAAGVSRPLSAGMSQWRYQPLAEAERAAERVASLLAPA